ncbi:MAG: helix-turn-helix domain-containing protein [Fimbriimonas sp.]
MRRRPTFTDAQIAELTALRLRAKAPHVRLKAVALCHLANGASFEAAARAVMAHRSSLSLWLRRYLAEGKEGLELRPGRGKKTRADKEEVERYLRQSPRVFEIPRTRWTLSLLARAVPSLKGMDPSSVWRALRRFGLSYKRGQPRVHSPDPLYEEKKGGWTRPS